jgi:undecaprenyl-diphosphatase
MGAGAIVTAFWLAAPLLGLIALPYGLLVVVGRVYGGKHWPSDVLVGAILGVLAAWLAWRLVPIALSWLGRGHWVRPAGASGASDASDTAG